MNFCSRMEASELKSWGFTLFSDAFGLMISDNFSRVKARIAAACARSGRDPEEICLVAVSKNRSVEEIKEALSCGIRDLGENRVQEALQKFDPASGARWHMVGHLQTNKARDAVRIFDLIQSVDSLRLAEEIDKQASGIKKIQDILIEVKTSPEESKFGLKPDEAAEVIKEALKLKNISIKGLMTIAPAANDPEEARPYFRMLKEFRKKLYELRVTSCELGILSMGMTDDFEIAVEEGANMLRIGRAIFQGEE